MLLFIFLDSWFIYFLNIWKTWYFYHNKIINWLENLLKRHSVEIKSAGKLGDSYYYLLMCFVPVLWDKEDSEGFVMARLPPESVYFHCFRLPTIKQRKIWQSQWVNQGYFNRRPDLLSERRYNITEEKKTDQKNSADQQIRQFLFLFW